MLSSNGVEESFNQIKLSAGADAIFYVVKFLLKDDRMEGGWCLNECSFNPGHIHLQNGGKICLIPCDQLVKIYIEDNRMKERFNG